MKRLALLFAAAAFLLFVYAVRSQSPLPEWVSITPAQDCSAGCWRLASAEYLDEGQSGGLHHIFAKTLDAGGNQIVDRFTVAWADGSVTVATKPPPDWGDVALFDCFFPDQNEIGGYETWAGIWRANSDVVSGLGLPYCQHVSYKLTWRWSNGGETPTPTPTPQWAHKLYLPTIAKP